MQRALRTMALALALTDPIGLAAQQPSATPRRFEAGQVAERVGTAGNAPSSYALYLPATYGPDRRRPVAFLMDPRGRALLPLECFRQAAERFGWILASSYDMRSDVAAAPSIVAFNAMLEDVQRRFAVDTRRLYLVGFSGTARLAWPIAIELGPAVAGIVAIGAGPLLAPDTPLLENAPALAYFGAAGVRDFNYDEVVALDAALDDSSIPHRIREFDGGHQWPPPDVCHEAVVWMEVEAMRSGLRPDDPELAARAAEFDASAATPALLERRAALHEETRRYQRGVSRYLEGLRAEPIAADPDVVLRALDVPRLRDQADDDAGLEAALWAARMLEHAWVVLSFYEPRVYLQAHEPARALALLRAARRVFPQRGFVRYREARALAELGRLEEGRTALREAMAAGFPPPADDDVWFGSVPPEPRYDELLRSVAAQDSGR